MSRFRRIGRSLLHWGGIVLTILATGFILREIWTRSAELGEFAEPGFLVRLALGVALCTGGAILTICGWRLALWTASPLPLPLADAASIYGRSNILKYLPSNVLHFAGRYAMLLERGFTHRAIITSTATEHALLVAAALVLALLFGTRTLSASLHIAEADHPAMMPLLAAGLALLLGVTWWMVGRGVRRDAFPPSRAVGATLLIVAIYLLYFLALGGAASLLATGSGEAFHPADYLTITGVVAAAFIAGLVTPGAPAGFGVRETVIVFALATTAFADVSLVIALGLRIATLAADAGLAVAGFALMRRRGKAAEADKR